MGNPILDLINRQTASQNPYNNKLSQIRNMMNTIRASKNPNAALSSMVQNNPQYRQAMNYVNQNGGNAKTAFYNLANQMGVNPNEILNMMK